ncbi:N-acetyltransferase [Mucilaginibacter pallidiroseus]|uniref:N-acetyltransferase n=1 Tax=Mucilaginibacter pallidiroseus TaxID=2599295 RepID=A0A563UHW8_9SPHI|nr:GNAT family N-acetyltransferase [Mucilaginibacter pallidiroseus]TWR30982.1 N-acetyltransferase [Mucilaginibacter pallidiroseus]
MDLTNVELVNNEEKHNFELFVEGQRAFIDYQLRGDKIYLIHTEVPVELEGNGIAAALVEKAFQYIEAHGLKMVVLCVYIQSYLKRHPEWERLKA